jgi:hypothetical protein
MYHVAAQRRRTRLVQALAATSAVLLLTAGCGAGQNAQTSKEVAAIPGIDADAGPICLRDLLIPYRADGYPAGSDVPLIVRLFSDAEQPVELSLVVPGPAGVLTVAAQHITLYQPTGVTTAHLSTPLTVQPGGYLLLAPPSGPYLVAEHTATTLTPNSTLPVRFTFSTGDSVEVDIPMAPPGTP